ncbi:MAG: hypothetical protein HYS70_04945 [Nitrospinae bacterium]|nr:hypothetical protein [Nitrospinota bacterium]
MEEKEALKKLDAMGEEEILQQWEKLGVEDERIIRVAKRLQEQVLFTFNEMTDFYAKAREVISLEEKRSYLKYIAKLKEELQENQEILEKIQQLKRLARMRSDNQKVTRV